MISTSGSGQMLPIPMNEFLQQNFAAVGMQIDFDVVEWGTMLVAIRSDPEGDPVARRPRHQHQPQLGRSIHHVPLLREGQLLAHQLQLGALRQRRRSPTC